MAEHTAPGTPGASPGTSQSARNSTGTQSETIVGRVRNQATTQLNTQKNKATEGLGSVVHAVRDTTQRLRDQKHDTVARYVEQAANQIERLSNGLKQKDVGELMHDAQELARRRPAMFVGGAFAAGLLGARFMKSSSERDREAEYRVEYTGRERAQVPGAQTTGGVYGREQGSASTGAKRSRSSSGTSRDPNYPPTEGM